MTAKKANKALTRSELLARLRAPEPRNVEVPGLGVVRVAVPSFERMISLRSSNGDESEFKIAVAMAACVDLQPEDWHELRKSNNGLALSALISAVFSADGVLSESRISG